VDEGGSEDEVSLSMKMLREGGLGELLLWGPWKMCWESLWIWAFLSMGPFQSRGTRFVRGSYTGDCWMDGGDSSGGASPCEGFHEGDPGGRAPLLGNPKDGVFQRLARFAVDRPVYPWGPIGGPGGGSSDGTFERLEKYICVPFLDPDSLRFKSRAHLKRHRALLG
jgi:hypothetical protein